MTITAPAARPTHNTQQALPALFLATDEVTRWAHDLEHLSWTTTGWRCAGTVSSTGKPCRKWPLDGSTLCRNHAPGLPAVRPPSVPSGPLVEAVHAHGLILSRHPKGLQRAYHRAKRNGRLTLTAADNLATTLLGEHPSSIWGDQWWTAQDLTDTSTEGTA